MPAYSDPVALEGGDGRADALGARTIMVFDGICHFCSASVRFTIPRDPRGRVRYAPMQSPIGARLMREHGLDPKDPVSFLLLDDGRAYQGAEAVLRLMGHLRPPWSWLRFFRLLPSAPLEWIYDRVARNRYRLLGRRDHCMMPDPSIVDRFL